MIRINDIIDKVIENNPDADVDIIDRAYIFSARVHDGQVRLSGEPYLSHPLEVAGILADMKLDSVSVAAGLLHDVIEDTHATPDEIEDIFGKNVLHIVSGVTKLSKLNYNNAQHRQAESIRKMLLAMADDIRVILIKLADRLHNMKTLKFHKESKRRRIAGETLDIYAPIASRLGIYWIKKELEDISFMYLMPEEYNKINNFLKKGQEVSSKHIDTIKNYMAKIMAENNLKCEVFGRYKSFYSIYQKMLSQNLAIEDIYDIIAFRIILDTVPQCYEALGVIHATLKPIDIKFKDYIGRPKPNGYKSLHTTVIGPLGNRIEIQIRTWEMDRIAKSGIAAHWSYKEGKKIDKSISEKFAWIQNLVDNQKNFMEPEEFLENVKIDLFPDEVYVFTPLGDIKTLPKGADPVDYAYMIHSEVGHQCTGAKVNGRIVTLDYILQTGDVIEILTSKNHHPSPDWLRFVKTVKARSRIRQWIKTEEKERSMTLGHEMCEKAFRKHHLNFSSFLESDGLQVVTDAFGFTNMDDLIANVGYGKITPLQIIRKIALDDPEKKERSLFNKLIGSVKKKKHHGGILVKGIDDALIRFDQCCHPLPGEPITGYITQGHGVTVHSATCINTLKMNPERRIDVEWNKDITETYSTTICVSSSDRVGLLADITSAISKNKSNILSLKAETRDNKMVDIVLSLSLKDAEHLKKVISTIKKIKQVHEIKRIS